MHGCIAHFTKFSVATPNKQTRLKIALEHTQIDIFMEPLQQLVGSGWSLQFVIQR